MKAYKELIKNVLENGQRYETGKGVCFGLIGAQVTYDISKGLPIVTGKKTNILWAIAEYAMFLKGKSNIDFLKEFGAEKIWESQSLSEDFVTEKNRDPSKIIAILAEKQGISFEEGDAAFKSRIEEYLKKRHDLDYNPPVMDSDEIDPETKTPVQVLDIAMRNFALKVIEDWLISPFVEAGIPLKENVVILRKGETGPIYGNQWRAWQAVAPSGQRVTIDQIKDVTIKLQKNPESRQIIMTAWNPANIAIESEGLDQKIKNGFMGQPPCHVNYHFLTRKNEAGEFVIHTTVWLRSNDLMVGHPFNAIGAALITHLIAKACGYKVGNLTMQISDAHVYENHLPKINQYLEAEIFEQPSFELPPGIDIFNFEVSDIMAAIGEYKHGPYIKFELNTNDNALAEIRGADDVQV